MTIQTMATLAVALLFAGLFLAFCIPIAIGLNLFRFMRRRTTNRHMTTKES